MVRDQIDALTDTFEGMRKGLKVESNIGSHGTCSNCWATRSGAISARSSPRPRQLASSQNI